MTPTLYGRWQTRLFLLSTVGLLITWLYSLGLFGVSPGLEYYWVLMYIGLLGVGWDILYSYFQKFLWDHDWPGIFQFLSAILEATLLVFLVHLDLLPHLSSDHFNLVSFIKHYSTVWTFSYLSSWTVMRILFPRWRFRGGEWLGQWPLR